MLQSLRHHLCRHVEEASLAQWFDPLAISLDETHNRITVVFPHRLFGQWFEQTGRPVFERVLGELYPDCSICYGRLNTGENQPGETPLKEPGSAEDSPVKKQGARCFSGKIYSFDTFLANRKNQFPLVSARQVAEKSNGRLYSPFVVTGLSGSGKTHLLRAIAHEADARGTYSSILLTNVEELARRRAVRTIFTHYDLVLVDDLQRIAQFPDLQKDMSFLCDAAKEADKQLVVSCLGRLSEYPAIHMSLRSRLESGLSVELREPDLDIRCRYIMQQSSELKLRLIKEHILLLAQRFKQLRSLEGVMLKIAAYCGQVKRDITRNELDQILKHTDGGNATQLLPEHIIAATSAHFSLAPSDLTGTSRKYDVVLARQIAMLLCRELTGASYPVLGRIFGGKDHTTVIHAVNKIIKLREHSKDIQKTFSFLKQVCMRGMPMEQGLELLNQPSL